MEELRNELAKLDLPELRKKAAKEYGIKLLPEYSKDDVIQLIVGKASGNTKFVTETTPLEAKNEKWGWSRIKVIRGRDATNNTHCQAAHNGFQFAIPYNLEVNLPTVTAEYLTTKKSPVPKQSEDGNGTIIEYEDRWIVQFIEKNYGPNGEKDYIPKSERGKYWNSVREAKLAKKRKFFEEMGFWPTDKALKDHMSAGYFNANRREQAA